MSDELDKNLYLEFISEQCRVITLISKEKKYPPKCSAFSEVQVKPCIATVLCIYCIMYILYYVQKKSKQTKTKKQQQKIHFWLGCLSHWSKIFSSNSAIK